MQVLGGVTNAKDLLPAGSVYGLPLNATVEVTVPSVDDVSQASFHVLLSHS